MAAVVEEERVFRFGGEFGAQGQVVFERLLEFSAEGDNALLVPFARHLQFAACEVDVGQVEAHEFGAADARVVEGEEYEAVALPAEILAEVDVVEEPVHFRVLEEGGQWGVRLGAFHEA